ncbi:MAG: winged helix-turn-helix domain-containing protein [Candidatus Woesearchaeota archaeon]
MSKKRGRLQIIYDILSSIRDKGGSIKPTHLLYKSNLSHQMMRGYLKELQEKGFIKEHYQKNKSKTYILTDKGYEYLAEYQKVLKFVESFGLDDE